MKIFLGRWLLLAGMVLVPGPAHAFERQWHVGGGMGVNAFADGSTTAGPAVALHGAYGLSDVFDLRMQVMGSTHRRHGQGFQLLGASAGISYKFDVLEWIPYLGLELGYYRFAGDTRPASLRQDELGYSIDLGLDYLLSSSVALGAEVRYHGFVLGAPASLGDAPLFTALLRAEYHWGW